MSHIIKFLLLLCTFLIYMNAIEALLDVNNGKSVFYKSNVDNDDDLLREELMQEDSNYSQQQELSRRDKKHTKERRGPKIWDQWGKWSACSVTCGVGKIVRWRHCVSGGCAAGEKEAQIKTCTLPSC